MLADAGWWPGFGLLWIVLVWGVVAFFFLAAARLEGRLEGRPGASGEAVFGERYAPRRDHGGGISRAAPRPEGPAVVPPLTKPDRFGRILRGGPPSRRRESMTARKLFSFPNPVNELSARLVAGGGS